MGYLLHPSYFILCLFPFRPHAGFAFVEELDMNDVRATADRAVFDVRLLVTCGPIEWNDNFFSTLIADVLAFLVHISAGRATATHDVSAEMVGYF